jgi:hypothetical protein
MSEKLTQEVKIENYLYKTGTVGSPFLYEFTSAPYRTAPDPTVPYRNRPSIVLKNTAPY